MICLMFFTDTVTLMLYADDVKLYSNVEMWANASLHTAARDDNAVKYPAHTAECC